MNKEEYRAAFDRVELRADFRKETIKTLTRAAGRHEKKEIITMKPKRTVKTALMAAALAAALVVSAAAAVMLLTPKDVAAQSDDPVLAAAFESAGAVQINESVQSGDYTFTLGGIVSGAGISKYAQDVDESRTYVVASVARADGAPLEGLPSIDFSPLVAGYRPQQVSAWTLGGGYSAFLNGGMAYYLFDCAGLEIFAGSTVYLAAGEGLSPSAETFTMAADGTYSFADGFSGAHALFTLPLDASKADPAAVEQFITGGAMPSQDDSEAGPAAVEQVLTDAILPE